MRSGDFDSFRDQLVMAGVTPRIVRRIVDELADHQADLVAEAEASGMSQDAAVAYATDRIGNMDLIAERMLSNVEFKTWVYRYPRIARVYLPLAYVLALPAAPVIAGIAHAETVARWGAALMLGAGVTAAMMLAMQLAILLV